MKRLALALLLACGGQVEPMQCQTDVGPLPPEYVFSQTSEGTESTSACDPGLKCASQSGGVYHYGTCGWR